MKTIFYHYNSQGMLCFNYRDENGRYINQCYLYYSFREALQKFRHDFNLRHKHIRLIKLTAAHE